VIEPTGPDDHDVMACHFVAGALVRPEDPTPNWIYSAADPLPARRELAEHGDEPVQLLRVDSTRGAPFATITKDYSNGTFADLFSNMNIDLLPTPLNSSDLILTKRQNGLVEKLAPMTAQFQYHMKLISPSGESLYISEVSPGHSSVISLLLMRNFEW